MCHLETIPNYHLGEGYYPDCLPDLSDDPIDNDDWFDDEIFCDEEIIIDGD